MLIIILFKIMIMKKEVDFVNTAQSLSEMLSGRQIDTYIYTEILSGRQIDTYIYTEMLSGRIYLVKAIKYTFFIVLRNKQCLLNNFY